MQFQKILNYYFANPKILFLVDGVGALISAFLLGVVLVRLEHLTGIPPTTFQILAFFPCLFMVYDFCCYFLIKKNIGFYLKIIAISNLIYCLLSVGLAFYHHQTIRFFGEIYLLFEILIIIFLVIIELKTVNYLLKSNQ